MHRDITQIQHSLDNALTVAQLIEELQQMDPNAIPVFVCDYGDRGHTQQALPVMSVEDVSAGMLRSTAYSQSDIALADADEQADDAPPELAERRIAVLRQF